MQQRLSAYALKFVKFLLGFVADNVTKDGSLSRLLALAFGLAAIVIAFVLPMTATSVAAITAFVSGGSVSLLTRNSGNQQNG